MNSPSIAKNECYNFTMLIDNVAFRRACDELGIKIKTLSRGWILELSKNEKRRLTYGNHLGLNSELAQLVAKDKVATSIILQNNKIPVVVEKLLDKFDSKYWPNNFPVVVKPNTGSRGVDVELCNNNTSYLETTSRLLKKYNSLAVSKYYDAEHEYRCFYLGGEIELMYAKVRSDNSWKHNLSGGAMPKVIQNQGVEALAREAGLVLGVNFVTIDILDTQSGLKVLEVNSGVSVRHLLEKCPDVFNKVVKMYIKALKILF